MNECDIWLTASSCGVFRGRSQRDGSSNCTEPALIWLDHDDAADYRKGERVFYFPCAAMKVRVS
jgi:hypothetical protein